MSITATIKSKTKDGGAVELTVEKSGDDTARLTAKNWTVPEPPANLAPKISDTKLYGAKVSTDGSTIMCKADVFGPDPDVTLLLNAAADAAKSVTITIRGTFGGWGDGVETYVLSDADFEAIRTFVTAAQYPVASA